MRESSGRHSLWRMSVLLRPVVGSVLPVVGQVLPVVGPVLPVVGDLLSWTGRWQPIDAAPAGTFGNAS